MNKNILKITTILSSLVLLPAIVIAKPNVQKESNTNYSKTVGNEYGGSFKQINVNTGDDGEVISASKDGNITNGTVSISKDAAYNKGSGVTEGETIGQEHSGNYAYSETANASKSGVEVDVKVPKKGIDKDVTLTDEQAAAIKHHKKNEKINHKIAKEVKAEQ